LYGRGAGEAFAFVVGDELVVGETLLVQLGSLLLELCLGSFSRRFLLGHASATLGDLCLLGSLGRRLTMLAHNILTALSQLALAGSQPSPFAGPWQQDNESDHDEDDDHNNDDQCCGHSLPPVR
jgi:hypothetical protein